MNSRLRNLSAILLMAAAYFLSGKLGLLLAIPPGYATAVWPASGIALAVVLVYGWNISPGIWLGSFLINVWTALDTSSPYALLTSMLIPAFIALGAMCQAMLGAWLVQRYVGYQNILKQDSDIVRILGLAGPLACLVSSSTGVGTLWLNGAITNDVVLFNWWTWWVGDSIGVMVFTPIVLVWTVRPYRTWIRRQLGVTLPLICMFSMVVLVFFNISNREQGRLRTQFEIAGNDIAQQMEITLDRYEVALTATEGFLAVWDEQPQSFDDFSKLLLSELPYAFAIAWDAYVPESKRADFEHRMHASGRTVFRITELDAQGKLVPASKRPYYIVVTEIVYSAPAKNAQGFDAASDPIRKKAFDLALQSNKTTATKPIELIGDHKRSPGFLLAHPIHAKHSKQELRGYAVILLRINNLISGVMNAPEYTDMRLRFLDPAAPAGSLPIYQSANYKKPEHGAMQYLVSVRLAQQDLQLELTLPASYLVAHRSWEVWLVLAVGLILTALLGVLLLMIVGRTTKVEQVVSERTAALQDSEQRFRSLLESAPDAMIIVRQDGRIDLVNSQSEKLFGYPRDEMIGQPIEMLIPERLRKVHVRHRNTFVKTPRTRAMGEGLELHGQRKDGSEFPIEISLSPLKSGSRQTVTATIRDVTDRKQAESYVRHLAHHDVLTQLPNRILMHERLKSAMDDAEQIGGRVGLMMVDLDHFKRINDSLGHHVGDELLVAIVQRLLSCVRKTDTVARMGGDEFVIVLPDVKSFEILEKVATNLQEQIGKPVLVGDRELVVTSSIGITAFPQDGKDAITLLKNADTAMYRAKEKGRNNYQWFKPDMLLAAEEQLDMENDLRRALERHEFKMHYQPLVSVSSGQLIGVEALLRWQHPTRGAVAPESFVSLAEDTGLIVPIGEWALRTACKEAKQIQDRLGLPINVAVNLSPRQFRQNNIRKTIEQSLSESGLAATCLTLEITENALVLNPVETAEILKTIRAMGVAIALDDFGTGYSSLSYITRYPIDKIKIDRSFVRDLGVDPNDTAIINAIIAMSHSLGIKVIAEGVENIAQLQHLREHGCDEAQGFYYSEPVPPEQIMPVHV